MTRDEYERSKARLEEQRRTGIELIETAYQAQLRALELVWMLQGEGTGGGLAPALASAAPTAPPPARQEPQPQIERPRRRSAAEVEADVLAALPRLPQKFTRRDVCQLLGYEPERAALYRALQKLLAEGRIQLEDRGLGQRASIYAKTGGDDSPAAT